MSSEEYLESAELKSANTTEEHYIDKNPLDESQSQIESKTLEPNEPESSKEKEGIEIAGSRDSKSIFINNIPSTSTKEELEEFFLHVVKC